MTSITRPSATSLAKLAYPSAALNLVPEMRAIDVQVEKTLLALSGSTSLPSLLPSQQRTLLGWS
jgi:hypothetical protein